MKTIDILTTTPLTEVVQGLQGKPIAILDGKTPVAVLLPVENADLESISLSLNPQFLAIIERSRRRHEREGGISLEEIRREFGMPPTPKPTAKPERRKRKAN